jgi:hypothetical protein
MVSIAEAERTRVNPSESKTLAAETSMNFYY